MSVADHIRTARISQGLSLRDVAERLGVSHPIVQGWEVGRHPVPLKRLFVLCQTLKLDYEDLIYPTWLDERTGRDHEILSRAEQRLAARRGAA